MVQFCLLSGISCVLTTGPSWTSNKKQFFQMWKKRFPNVGSSILNMDFLVFNKH